MEAIIPLTLMKMFGLLKADHTSIRDCRYCRYRTHDSFTAHMLKKHQPSLKLMQVCLLYIAYLSPFVKYPIFNRNFKNKRLRLLSCECSLKDVAFDFLRLLVTLIFLFHMNTKRWKTCREAWSEDTYLSSHWYLMDIPGTLINYLS